MSDSSSHVAYPSWLRNNQTAARWVDNLPQPLRRQFPSPMSTASTSLSGTHISSASSDAQLLPIASLPYRGSPETVTSLASSQIITNCNYGNSSRHDACRMVQYPLNIMIPGTTHLIEPLEHVGNFTTDGHSSTDSSRYLAVGGLTKADLDSGNLVEFLEKVLGFPTSFLILLLML